MSFDDIVSGVSGAVDFLNGVSPLSQSQQDQFKSDGFLLPATFSADGTGLPSSKVPSYRNSQLKRNIITWFVPEFGIVRMYVNPASISYTHKKLISRDRTKGGYTLQYWGEDLSQLNINGTTGGAGVEGINVLYEVYRAEQYAFDATGLSLAANNAATPNLLSSILGTGGSTSSLLGGTVGGAVGAVGSLLGMSGPSTGLVANSINSLAQLAFTVEMYYNGWVYRGFFDSMTINERADNFLLEYNMVFTVTQRRGYRMNYFPWSKSAIDGPSQYTSPQSFSGSVTPGVTL
jgi:hypothetical protein